MRLSTLAVLAFAVSAGAASSQVPELMHQYYQRLGGTVDELRRISDRFDDNARRVGHDRTSALAKMSSNPEPLVQGLAGIEISNAERLSRLSRQLIFLSDARTFDRFIYLVRNYDPPLASATWQAFVPAVPLSEAGAGFAAAGFAAAFCLLSVLIAGVRRALAGRRTPPAAA